MKQILVYIHPVNTHLISIHLSEMKNHVNMLYFMQITCRSQSCWKIFITAFGTAKCRYSLFIVTVCNNVYKSKLLE